MPIPSGTVTLLFTDIEGSTHLWERAPEEMARAHERHDHLLRHAMDDNEGYVFKTVGDAFCVAFATAHPDVLADAQKVPANVIATAQSIPANVITAANAIPPSVLATAQADQTQLANAVKFAPELTAIQANPALFTKLATFTDPSSGRSMAMTPVPPRLMRR